jgi:SAM-dependent methyltransferase
MQHVNYKEWADYANELIRNWLPGSKSVLDVACGTGNILLELKRYRYQLSGCDSSYPMILQASYKRELNGIPLWQSDMSTLRLRRKVDVVLCLYDSINYIMNRNEILNFFESAHRFLTPNGILIFDICTEYNSLKFFSNYYDHEKNDEFTYNRWSHYDSRKRIQFTEFKLKFSEDPITYLEVHRQKIYPVEHIQHMIESSPLELLDSYDGFTHIHPSASSNRIHFVLQRKA